MWEINYLSLLRLQNVTKCYQRGTQTFTALSAINFELQPAELTAIVGMSGSGKSTLMNIIGLLDQSFAGEYWFKESKVTNLSQLELAQLRNQKIGFVFQSFYLLPRLTALQNILLPLTYQTLPSVFPKSAAIDLARGIMEELQIDKLADQRPNQLSGGQQQRVAIARALINNPELILADEPTGSLDSTTGNEVMAVFKKLHREQGKTILIITHDTAISQQCQRVVTIQDGRI